MRFDISRSPKWSRLCIEKADEYPESRPKQGITLVGLRILNLDLIGLLLIANEKSRCVSLNNITHEAELGDEYQGDTEVGENR